MISSSTSADALGCTAAYIRHRVNHVYAHPDNKACNKVRHYRDVVKAHAWPSSEPRSGSSGNATNRRRSRSGRRVSHNDEQVVVLDAGLLKLRPHSQSVPTMASAHDNDVPLDAPGPAGRRGAASEARLGYRTAQTEDVKWLTQRLLPTLSVAHLLLELRRDRRDALLRLRAHLDDVVAVRGHDRDLHASLASLVGFSLSWILSEVSARSGDKAEITRLKPASLRVFLTFG